MGAVPVTAGAGPRRHGPPVQRRRGIGPRDAFRRHSFPIAQESHQNGKFQLGTTDPNVEENYEDHRFQLAGPRPTRHSGFRSQCCCLRSWRISCWVRISSWRGGRAPSRWRCRRAPRGCREASLWRAPRPRLLTAGRSICEVRLRTPSEGRCARSSARSRMAKRNVGARRRHDNTTAGFRCARCSVIGLFTVFGYWMFRSKQSGGHPTG